MGPTTHYSSLRVAGFPFRDKVVNSEGQIRTEGMAQQGRVLLLLQKT